MNAEHEEDGGAHAVAGRKAKTRRRQGGGKFSPSRRAETAQARRILPGCAHAVMSGAFASGLPAVQHVPGGDPVRSAAVPAGDLRHVPFGGAEAHAFVEAFQPQASFGATSRISPE